MFNRIDRYILALFLRYFASGLIVVVTLYLVVDFMGFAVHHNQNASEAFVRYYLFSIPGLVYQMMPVACLLSTVFTFSTLSRNSELTALHSFGMSLARVSAPVLIAVVGISVAAFFISDRVLPRFEQKKNYIFYVEIEKQPGLYSTVTTNKIWYRSENMIFNLKTLNTIESKAQGLTLYFFDESWNLIELMTAREVDMHPPHWNLHDGTVTLFDDESSFPLTKSYTEKLITVHEDLGDFHTASNSSNVMSLAQLSRFITKNKEAGLDTLRYEVDYYSKFGFAFAGIVMCLLAIPFSLQRARSGGVFLNLGICLLMAFLYWTLYSSSLTLGNYGHIPPLLAAWGPNGLILTLALAFIWRLRS
jgi:lipopolysaccharide export system permease protein